MTIYIDADEILYGATSAAEDEVYFGDITAIASDFSSCKRIILDKVGKILTAVDGRIGDVVFALSGYADQNFRREIFPLYKAHRRSQRKPLNYRKCEAWLEEAYPCRRENDLEADDIMGIMSGNQDIIVSSDKDMGTIPGVRIYSPYHGVMHQPRTQEEADWYWIYQTLIGDRVDGYPGCPGVGDKKAKALLAPVTGTNSAEVPYLLDLKEAWAIVLEAFRKATDKAKVSAMQNARCARILRPGEYVDGKPLLWTP